MFYEIQVVGASLLPDDWAYGDGIHLGVNALTTKISPVISLTVPADQITEDLIALLDETVAYDVAVLTGPARRLIASFALRQAHFRGWPDDGPRRARGNTEVSFWAYSRGDMPML
ncbi:hypothetical protein ACELLULO517_08125 [Acidisoma cellulosilytica]|uniref:Uncharacterized protein n=1 Tax=Acidisoma cellulosilyticum TaxID=2802395 RepID=A0A963Z007_9PROT|nr:hypothetical protein [Acidisoma cellulosilyticum]MCB8880195.1 hypothetical protein [Acidisoma cellulosilyticum]